MTPEGRLPLPESPGKSEVTYRCTECPVIIGQVENDPVIEQLPTK